MRMIVELEGFAGFEMLYKNSWGDAVDTVETIKQYHMEEELMEYLGTIFNGYDEPPTDTRINDFLAYVFSVEEFIAKNISFNTLEDLDELEDYTKNLYFRDAQVTITEAKQQDKEEKLWEYLQDNFDMRNLLEVMEELAELDIDDLNNEDEEEINLLLTST